MSKSSVKKNLQKLDREKLIDIILGVYDFNKDSKAYIENIFDPHPEKELEKYKKIIDKEFYPWGNSGLKFSVCRKGISEFKKMNPPAEMIADLMLYLPEAAVHYTHYADLFSTYYNTLLNNCWDALHFISENNLTEKFIGRIYSLYQEALDCYGFKSSLEKQIYTHCREVFTKEVDDYDDSDMDFEDDEEV